MEGERGHCFSDPPKYKLTFSVHNVKMDSNGSNQSHLPHKRMKMRSNDDGNDMKSLPKCNGPKIQPF
jgi:hypothetical protein